MLQGQREGTMKSNARRRRMVRKGGGGGGGGEGKGGEEGMKRLGTEQP